MIHARIVVLGLALSLVAGCGKKKTSFAGDKWGLTAQLGQALTAVQDKDHDRLVALTKDLSLPDPKGFYTKTFGAEHADALVAELDAEHSTKFGDDAPTGIADLVEHGYTNVQAECFDAPSDQANGFQNVALRQMKAKTALCTARFTKNGETDGFTLWSFVYVDGAFRMAGKMKALAPTSDDPMIDQLGELPVADAKKLLEQK